jgi:glycosyltransferase A (GT-A) superfamily protein (DUF2064 family)
VLERGSPAAVAPSADGGYVVLGLCRPLAELFREVPWGRRGVYTVTRERAREARIELAELAPWYDVDDADGLQRLRAELAGPDAARRAPATARFLDRLDWREPTVV